MSFKNEPLMNVVWKDAVLLKANGWNPNVVLVNELRLLELSILETGWIQPLIITKDDTIIDGYHRWRLSLSSKDLRDRYAGMVPCVVLSLTAGEAKMLTVRINRAKGTNRAFKMAEMVKSLVDEHGYPMAEIAKKIGAPLQEVEILYQESVFTAKDIANYTFSKAWTPGEVFSPLDEVGNDNDQEGGV